VLPQTGLFSATSPLPIDIRRFPWTKRLAADYAFEYGRLAAFFAGDPSQADAWRGAIARAQQHARQREVVASLVHAQQRRRGSPEEAVTAAAELHDPRAVAVVTGQQAGLFGGPLFTLLKAVTAVRLAARVREEHRVPAVPVFWIDADDHDWNEVKSCGVFDRDLALHQVSVGDPPGAHARPVSQVTLDATAVQAIDVFSTLVTPTEFTPRLLESLRLAYAPGLGMSEAFGRWLDTVLGARGLVVFDAGDPASKPPVADLFAREVDHGGETWRLAAKAGAALEAGGYHAQATPHADGLALFWSNNGRTPIEARDGRFAMGAETLTPAALADRIRQSPEAFSPGVILRPVVQDTLFPTVCYVAGPNELAYLAQLAGVYRAFGVPMPLMYPRVSATLLDSNGARLLSRHALPFESLRARDEAALNTLLESRLPPDITAAVDDLGHAIGAHMARVAGAVTQVDPTLEGAARSVEAKMRDDLARLHGKIVQAAKRRDETLRRQFHRAQAQAFPNGRPQEREVGFVYFLNRYGPALVDRLLEDLPLDIGLHWVVAVQTSTGSR
jgi:bacillithiol biosynthesis cysteine-adding enzyme BshC